MNNLHEQAKTTLGDKYNEVEFNKLLLSEGSGPTLTRAQELTNSLYKALWACAYLRLADLFRVRRYRRCKMIVDLPSVPLRVFYHYISTEVIR